MYNITSRIYKARIDTTTINIVQENPYRAFEIDLHGDISNMVDEDIIKKAKAILAREFSPDLGVAEIDMQLQEQKEKISLYNQRIDIVNERVTKQEEAQEQLLNTIVHFSDLSDEQLDNLINQYPAVNVGDVVVEGKIYNLDGVLYEAIKTVSIDAENWIGDASLFKKYLSGSTEEGQEIIHDYIQPTGGHDAYQTGDKVRFNGEVYQSNRDGNVWSPADLPSGWDLVEGDN